MKNKMHTIFVIAIMLLALIPQTALASASVTADKLSVLPGETVSISGTAGAQDSVVVKITDNADNIVFFDAAKADAGGKYSVSFVVPTDMAAGKLTVTAGSGDDVAKTMITVKDAPKPTAKPTSTSQPTTSPSVSPSETAQSTTSPSVSPGASDDEPSPTPSSEGEEIAVKPKEITRDDDTGIITVVIDIADLPEGTVAVETPDGEVLYVSDAKDGVIVIEVTQEEVDANGEIEIVALDDEMMPLAALHVKVLDENEEIVITGEERAGAWIIIICVAGGLLVLGAVLWILLKRRNRTAGDDTGSDI